jgi:2-iminobutanoate/2-iminopropanoate deaminase
MTPQASNVQVVSTTEAPAAIGPYSQAIVTDGWVFTSGQIALDPETGEMVSGGPAAQARRALDNLRGVLAAAGSDFAHVVKATIFLHDMAYFAEVNQVWSQYFEEAPPARSTVAVAGLPRQALVEIELVARVR